MAKSLTSAQVSTQIRLAIKAAESGFTAGSVKLSTEFSKLGLVSYQEQEELLKNVLQEIALEHQTNPSCYNGPYHPYDLSKEPKCKGIRMLQFVWNSNCCNRQKMFVKFCLHENRLVLLSVHPDYELTKFSKMEEQTKKKI